MAWYPYSYKTAFDPISGEKAPAGSVGEVYAVGDTGFTTPLETFDLTGLPVALEVQGDVGYVPSFQVEDNASVIWKSGDYIFEMVTSMPLPGPQGANVVGALDNGDGTVTFSLSNGESVGPVDIPEGPQGARGPAGYNATDAVQDQETLADYILRTAGANPVSDALDEHYGAVVDVRRYGAVGDGVTNDTAAIDAAITAAPIGAKVLLPAGHIFAMGPYTFTKRVQIDGWGATIKPLSVSGNWLNVGASGISFHGVVVDGTGVTGQVLNIQAGQSAVRLFFAEVKGASATATLRVRGTQKLDISNCAFDDVDTAVWMDGGPSGSVRDNRITNWRSRGIYLDGESDLSAAKDLSIERNSITEQVAGEGTPRHPIQIIGTNANPHQRVSVNYNTIIGNYTSHTDLTTPGTADQISLHRCEDFEVIGNISLGGGDMGITVSQQCARGVVAGNVCRGNDVSGITLGSSQATYVRDVAVTGNVCLNNGVNRMGDRNAVGRAGIRVWNSTRVTATGNNVSDTGAGTQQYGLSVVDSTAVTDSGNICEGVALQYLYEQGASGAGRSPFAASGGLVSGVTLTANVTATVNVSYPAGRFTVPPLVQIYVVGGSMTAPPATTYRSNTVSGVEIDVRSSVDRTVTVQWYAFQMTPESNSG